jgi:uncharacterized protein (TIRG00374 family)
MKFEVKRSNIIGLVILTVAVMYFVMKGDLSNILNQIAHANPFWFAMGLFCIILYWMFEARTLHIMLKAYDKSFSYLEVLKLTVSTQFFNGITPFASGGQPFQIYVLTKRSKLNVSSVTSASIHNFIMYQTVLVLMGTSAIILEVIFNIFPDESNFQVLAIFGFILNFIIISALVIIAVSPTLTHRILKGLYWIIGHSPFKKRLPKITETMDNFVDAFHEDILVLLSDKKMYIHALILNIGKLLSFYTVAYFICLAVGFNGITLFQAIIASAYVMLITSIVPLPGASGGAEMGFLIFFGSFLIGPQGTAIMLLWRFITYYLGLFAGLLTIYFGYPRARAQA